MRSAKTTFRSLPNNTCIMLGALSEITGQRPSSFFEWSDNEEWQERLMFDLYVVGLLKKEEKKQYEEAQRKIRRH